MQSGLDYHSFANIEQFRVTHVDLELARRFPQQGAVRRGRARGQAPRPERHRARARYAWPRHSRREREADERDRRAGEERDHLGEPAVSCRQGGPDARQPPGDRAAAAQALDADHQDRVRDLAGCGVTALAGRRANRRQAPSAHVHPVRAHRRARLDSAAGHPAGARHLLGGHPYRRRLARGDERHATTRRSSTTANTRSSCATPCPRAASRSPSAICASRRPVRARACTRKSRCSRKRPRSLPIPRRCSRPAETLFGAYRFERCDLVVLPPALSAGGGGQSERALHLVDGRSPATAAAESVVALALAQAWAGDLVSGATLRDAWIDAGLAVYMQNRLVQRGVRRGARDGGSGLRGALGARGTRTDESRGPGCLRSISGAAIRPCREARRREGRLVVRLPRRQVRPRALRRISAGLFRSLRVQEHHHRGVPRLPEGKSPGSRSRAS